MSNLLPKNDMNQSPKLQPKPRPKVAREMPKAEELPNWMDTIKSFFAKPEITAKKPNGVQSHSATVVRKGVVIEMDSESNSDSNIIKEGTKVGNREVRVISQLSELPDFEKPTDDIPKSPNALECIVIFTSQSATHTILVTQDYSQNKEFFSFKNRIAQKSQYVNTQHAEPALIIEISNIFLGKTSRKKTIEDSAGKTKARELFLRIINQGIKLKASDVHICVREETGAVLYRVNGVIRKWKQYLSPLLTQSIAVGFTLEAQEKTRSESAFQAGAAQKCMIPFMSPDGKKYNLRYQSEPTIGGFDVVIRFLKDSSREAFLTLEQLGYEESQREDLSFSSSKAIGVTMIAGVTGSGKTTTLNTLLRTLPGRDGKKIYAYEDPTEYRIPGVSHVSIPAKNKDNEGTNPFLEPMKNFLRLDPDVGMLGEIRDNDSAMILQQAVESGHQIFTTVHATSAFGIIKRLLSPQIGLTREVLGADDFLTSLVYQRLIPVNCPHCKIPAKKVLSNMKLAALDTKYGLDVEALFCASDPGCDQCAVAGLKKEEEIEGGRLGIKGQTVIAEIVIPDDDIREMISTGKDGDAKRYWRKKRRTGFDDPDMTGKTAFEHGLYKVSKGLIDVRYLEDAFMGIEYYGIQDIT